MTLNNWLCRILDTKKRGYVTVGDVGERVIIISFALGGIILFMFLIYRGTLFILNEDFFKRIPDGEPINIVGFIGAILLVFSVIGLLGFFLWVISNIKIAICERKQ